MTSTAMNEFQDHDLNGPQRDLDSCVEERRYDVQMLSYNLNPTRHSHVSYCEVAHSIRLVSKARGQDQDYVVSEHEE